jgi:hypothetical protein
MFELDTVSNATFAINCNGAFGQSRRKRLKTPPASSSRIPHKPPHPISTDQPYYRKMGLLETVYQSVILSVVSNILAQVISAHQENVHELHKLLRTCC